MGKGIHGWPAVLKRTRVADGDMTSSRSRLTNPAPGSIAPDTNTTRLNRSTLPKNNPKAPAQTATLANLMSLPRRPVKTLRDTLMSGGSLQTDQGGNQGIPNP